MKAENKQKLHSMKIRERRKREQRRGLTVTVAILVTIIFISGFLINSILNQPSPSHPISSTSQPKATIVDHLSLTFPNQTFVETATSILEQAGYSVDYYLGENVTVEFFRNLPTHGYGLIILRVHSTNVYGQFFTSEEYSTNKYVYEQLTDQVIRVSYTQEEPPYYFGISPLFVKSSMKGRFNDTVVVMMGCDGLKNVDMAEAFIEKGAKAYVGWNESVLASHTDQAATRLLQHFLTEKLTLKQSIQETLKEVGADPAYNSQLTYYPLEAGEQTIQDINGN